MELLKKHYEKILLGIVLVGLAGAVGFLYFKVGSEKDKLEEIKSKKINPRVDPLPAIDLAAPKASLIRVSTPPSLDFSEPNKLFNPLPWQETAPPDKHLIPTTRVGPVAAVVTNIAPLYLRLTLDSITGSETNASFMIGIQKETAATPAARSKTQKYAAVGLKADTFTLLEVTGKPEEPTLVLKLNDTGERATLSRAKPFQRVDGYMATVLYPPENRTFANARVGALLKFAGEDYNIVAINENEVVLSAKSNGKKWTIRLNQNPAP